MEGEGMLNKGRKWEEILLLIKKKELKLVEENIK